MPYGQTDPGPGVTFEQVGEFGKSRISHLNVVGLQQDVVHQQLAVRGGRTGNQLSNSGGISRLLVRETQSDGLSNRRQPVLGATFCAPPSTAWPPGPRAPR